MNASVRFLSVSLILSVIASAGLFASQDPNGGGQAVKDPPDVVARIHDYTITKDELLQRLKGAVQPSGDDDAGPREPVTAQSVLLEMVAEKAMMMEGRRLGYLNDAQIQPYLERQRQQRLGGMLRTDHMRANLSIDPAEVDKMVKSNPKLTREQAERLVTQSKGMALLEQFYKQLLEKRHLKRMTENFPRVAQIHDRLLNRPASPRREAWILLSQISNDLAQEEKNLVLATFDGGQVTALDWFRALHEIIPPRRPANLSTPEGVEQFLDRSLRIAVFVTEAESRGYHKRPDFLQQMRELEDQQLLYKAQDARTRGITEPNEQQIKAYFEKNQARFGDSPTLKLDQIWCEDLQTARRVREMLDGGADFKPTKEAHSVQKSEPYNVYPSGEGPFWEDLWKGEPNQVIGPVKGFSGEGIAWRVVKVIEKTPGKLKPYSDEIGNRVKWAIMGEQRAETLKAYRKELLEKYEYKLYADRIKDIDPLAVAEKKAVPAAG